MGNTSLVETRKPAADVSGLAGHQITTPQQLADRIREMHGQAHVLSPMAAVAAIAPGFVVNPVVVVIDPSVDAESGRGADVYFQAAIHKKRKTGNGEWVPDEVSLNKIGLMKILTASGANVYPTQRLDDGRRPYYWSVMAQADVTDFDGATRRLPPGSVEIDLQDGSPQIGGWTPEEWAKNVAAANAKAKPGEEWKSKPQAIGGWTAERVMGARKFGLRLAEAKALNALARNLGVKGSYRIEELAKPFVIFRASYVPDASDPAVRLLLTERALGARALLYGHAPQEHPVSHGAELHHGDPTQVLDAVVETAPARPVQTAAPPADAQEVTFDEAVAATEPVYHVKTIRQGDEWYFIETTEGQTFATSDKPTAKGFNDWRKAQVGLHIEAERVQIKGETYLQVLGAKPALKL